MDLEFRWSAASQTKGSFAEQSTVSVAHGKSDDSSQPLLLEQYLIQHPDLGSSQDLSVELITEEYVVRQRFADRPGHEEYFRRFPHAVAALQRSLTIADAELTQQLQPSSTGHSDNRARSIAAGRFTILQPHARGGLGEVSIARDEKLKRNVALKEIRLDHLADTEARKRFLNEATITGQLEHPGLCQSTRSKIARTSRPTT